MSEAPPSSRRLEKLIEFLVIVTLLVQPTQYGINAKAALARGAEFLGLVTLSTSAPTSTAEALAPAPAEVSGIQRVLDRMPSATFTLADVLIWLLLVLWALKLLLYREFKVTRLWPLSVSALVVWAGLSMVQQWKPVGVNVEMGEAVKEMIQLVEYLIAGYLVFVNTASREYAFRRMVLAFGAATTGVVLIALLQYMNLPGPQTPLAKFLEPSDDPMRVQALFGDRNVLGGYLALALPFLWGIVLAEKNLLIRLWLAAVTLSGLLVILSGGAMLATLLAILGITAVRGQKALVPALVVLFLAGFFVWPMLPRSNTDVLVDSVLLYKAPKKVDDWPWQQRYVEWQPALLAMKHSPLWGVGVGNYQRHINQFYGEISKPAGRNFMEPNAINGYAILGVTAGVPALLALVWVVLDFRRRASMANEIFEDGIERGVALGVMGSLTSFAIVMLFTNIFVRGVGIAFVFLLAMAAVVGRLAWETRAREQKEEQGLAAQKV